MAYSKHLSLSDRILIEKYLHDQYSFKAIGRELQKDCTTISKEIKSHLIFKKTGCFEFDSNGNHRTRIFFCDPNAPYQKGAAENNHTFIRRILPKGTSFDDLTQEKVTLMMNHINSYRRKKLGDRSPHEMFQMFYGKSVLEILKVALIPPDDIELLPTLLK